MTMSPITELVVPFDPGPLTDKVARRRGLVRSRIVSLVITLVILVAVYFWQRDQLRGPGFFVVYGVVVGIPVVWLAVVLVLYLRARRRLRSLPAGVAVQIGPPGIFVGGLGASWWEVASVAAAKPGPVLRLTLTDGRTAAVPFEQISVFPASLDGAVRAFSASRFGVDLTALDN